MKINHLQLNTSTLRDPRKIMDFIEEKKIDIACLQEICYPLNGNNPLANIVNKPFEYTEGVHFYYLPKNQTLGVGIISKFPIIDVIRTFYNTDNYQPKTIKPEDEFSGTVINDTPEDSLLGSRGIKHSIKSRCILSILVQTPFGIMRVLTTHFTVSDLCTETTQMYDMSQQLRSLIENSQDYPTILSGDLNIRAQSYSVMNLQQVLTCHTTDISDTLSKTHIAKQKDFPNGLAIDHVFSKNLKHLNTEALEVDFSEHKAIVTTFESI